MANTFETTPQLRADILQVRHPNKTIADAAYSRVLAACEPFITKIVSKYFRGRRFDDFEDAMQQSRIRLYNACQNYDPKLDFAPMLHTAIRYEMINFVRMHRYSKRKWFNIKMVRFGQIEENNDSGNIEDIIPAAESVVPELDYSLCVKLYKNLSNSEVEVMRVFFEQLKTTGRANYDTMAYEMSRALNKDFDSKAVDNALSRIRVKAAELLAKGSHGRS